MMNKTYQTSDRWIITWLRYRGYEYSSVDLVTDERNGKRKVTFTYEETEDLLNDVDGYLQKKSYDMSPHVFVKECESVMNIIHQKLNQNG